MQTSSSSNDDRADNSNGSLQWDKEIKFPIKRQKAQWLNAFESAGEDLVYQCRIESKHFPEVMTNAKEIHQVIYRKFM